jgi:mycothiol synthase
MELQVIRKVSPERLGELQHLFDAVTSHDHHNALGEHKWLDLVHGGREGFAGIVATEPGHDPPTHGPVGYAHLSRHAEPGGAEWGLEVVVHPEHRGVGAEVALVEAALDVVASAGGGHLHLWVFQPSEIHEGLAHHLGLARGRDLLHMRVPLPVAHEPKLPDGVRIRAFEPGSDEQAWLDVNNTAFEHHPEQGAWDMETLKRRMGLPWFDPADLLLAVDDSGVVGSNWTKLDADSKTGEIYVIAVDPSRHGSGLGKALSIAGLQHMHERGMTEGTLYVDAANEKAVAMYRNIGFEPDHVDRAYVTDVEPAG